MSEDGVRTQRLLLRPSREADAERAFAFLGDPETMRFTDRMTSLEQCREYLAAHRRQAEQSGFGAWTITLADDDAIIGWGGLYVDPFDRRWGAEVGYFFHRSAWGQGYATEVTQAAIDQAARLGLEQVLAFAHPDNTASQRVLQKAGFKTLRFVEEMNRNLYRWGPAV
ncbi:GNAT family N-acetyltransferase [Pelagibius sp.]|uniref:GNAT family N-acetyltransferase n=1 Tax=Pelagibius sp. TaxID=1931238 RepID=UPI00261F0DBE|nr:GNAT family N-acetyltransferase [Pelagibius sp.]